ncbi:MAG: hypothetical protein QJR09_05155 [Micrococcus sp.]|nr:hypothetical protein [Micrococcus sp.]
MTSPHTIAAAILQEPHSPDELARVAYLLMDSARRDAHLTVEHTARTTIDPAANAAAASDAAKLDVAFHALHAAALPMPYTPLPIQPRTPEARETLQNIRDAQKARREGKA